MRLGRARRYAVRALLVVATALAVAATFAVWADRQLLDADNWARTSSDLLADERVRVALADYLVDQAYAEIDVSAELAEALPPRLRPLAGPAAGGLRTVAERGAEEALGRPRVQAAWESANRLTAEQFIAIAEDRSRAITVSGGAVVLDLRAVLIDLVDRLGLPGRLASQLPDDAAQLRIMDADQVETLQEGATIVNGLAEALPLLAIALLALAVWLARGRRRETLLWAGWALVLAGLIVLVGRELAGDWLVDELATTQAAEAPAEAVWSIGTELLRDVAQACVVLGIPPIVAAWLAGPSAPALLLRQAAAPWLRERPLAAFASAGALGLLVVWWEPIPATRRPLAVLLMFVLLAVAVEALRRQTAREFPAASIAAAHASLHDRAERTRAALAGLVRRGRAGEAGGAGTTGPGAAGADVAGTPAAGAGTAGPGAAGAGAMSAVDAEAAVAANRLALLERLAALHDRGVLSDAEFAAEKSHLLNGRHAGVAP